MAGKEPLDLLSKTDRARARRLVLGGAEGAKRRQQMADNLDDTRSWIDPNGYVLSDRIWRARATDRAAIDGILRESLAAGDDPIRTARRLAQYLTPLGSQQTTTTPRGGRGLYAARRLARTETTRAFGQATIEAAKRSRFGVKLGWRTSDRHSPVVDNGVCLANQEGGPYTTENVPQYPSHPHCRCTLLPIAEDPEAVADQLKAELAAKDGTGAPTWDNLEQAARGGDRKAAQALLDLAQRNGWISPADASFQATYLGTATKADLEDLVDFLDEGRSRAGGAASTAASKTPVREGFQLPPRATGLKADQIRIQGMSDIRVVADEALDLIDQVHTDGALPRIPVSEEYVRPGAPMGAFQPGKTPDGRQIAVEMRLNPAKDYAQHAKATFVHETGHFMDLAVMGRDGVFGSAEVGGELQAWRRAVEETRAVKALRANRGGTVTGRGVDGLPVTRQTDDRYTDYLLQPEEMWARSYTQYVAERTGDPDLRWSLDQERPGTLSGDWYQAHWTTEDFAPVRAEIDNLFRRRGWID